MMLVGSGALAGSGAAAFAGESVPVFVLAGVVGLSSTLIRPALQALLPSLARTPGELIASNGATSTIESLGTLVGPLVAGGLAAVANVGLVFVRGVERFWSARAAGASSSRTHQSANDAGGEDCGARSRLVPGDCLRTERSATRRARRGADVRQGC
jgi:hypothetical protein